MPTVHDMAQEIGKHMDRIRKTDPADVNLQNELSDTVLFYQGKICEALVELTSSLVGVRDGTQKWLDGVTNHVEQLDDRLGTVEGLLSGSSQLEAEHADMLERWTAGSLAIFVGMLENQQLDDTARKNLEAHVELGRQCETFLAEHRMDDDDEEDDDADDADASAAATEAS